MLVPNRIIYRPSGVMSDLTALLIIVSINIIITLMCVCVQLTMCAPYIHFFLHFWNYDLAYTNTCSRHKFQIWLQWCWLHLNTIQLYYYYHLICSDQSIFVVMGQTTCKLSNQSETINCCAICLRLFEQNGQHLTKLVSLADILGHGQVEKNYF